MRKLKAFILCMGICITVINIMGCGSQSVSQVEYDQLVAENAVLKASLQDCKQLEEENAQLKIALEEANKKAEEQMKEEVEQQESFSKKITGGFTASVHAVMPDYCADSTTPSVAVVNCFQDGPFVLDVGAEIAQQLTVGELYYFEVEEKEIEGLTEDTFHNGYADPVEDLRKYHVEIASVREPNEDEIGLESIKLYFR